MQAKLIEFVSELSPLPEEHAGATRELPTISIIIPSYNQGEFLSQCIFSIVNQQYPRTEIIVVDGASTDNTLSVIRNNEKHLSRWISEPDRGQWDAIQKGLRWTSGQIVAWQNADDIYLPGTFRVVAQAFLSSESVDTVYGNTLLVDKNLCTVREIAHVPASFDCVFYSAFHWTSQSLFWSTNVQRRIAPEMELIDLTIGMERWMAVLLLRHSRIVKFLHKPLGAFRLHEDCKTWKNIRTEGESEISKREDVLMRRALKGLGVDLPYRRVTKCRCWLRKMYYHFRQGDWGMLIHLVRNVHKWRTIRWVAKDVDS